MVQNPLNLTPWIPASWYKEVGYSTTYPSEHNSHMIILGHKLFTNNENNPKSVDLKLEYFPLPLHKADRLKEIII